MVEDQNTEFKRSWHDRYLQVICGFANADGGNLYIGIDVHKANYHVALYLNDAHAIDFITPADNAKLCATLKKLHLAIKNIVYEAGPTGYSLARQLQQASLPVQIIAPSKTVQQ